MATKKPQEFPSPFKKPALGEGLEDTEEFLNRDRKEKTKSEDQTKPQPQKAVQEVSTAENIKTQSVSSERDSKPTKKADKTEKVKFTFYFSEDVFEDFDEMFSEGKRFVRKNHKKSLSQSEFVEFLTVFAKEHFSSDKSLLQKKLDDFLRER